MGSCGRGSACWSSLPRTSGKLASTLWRATCYSIHRLHAIPFDSVKATEAASNIPLACFPTPLETTHCLSGQISLCWKTSTSVRQESPSLTTYTHGTSSRTTVDLHYLHHANRGALPHFFCLYATQGGGDTLVRLCSISWRLVRVDSSRTPAVWSHFRKRNGSKCSVTSLWKKQRIHEKN